MTYNPTAAWDRGELDRLRTENADLQYEAIQRDQIISAFAGRWREAEVRVEALTQELATVRDTLRHRSNALNATGTHNDQLRATLARVEKVALMFEQDKFTDWRADDVANEIRAALADKEPTP